MDRAWSEGKFETSVQGLAVFTGSSGDEQDPTAYTPDLTCTYFRVIAVDEDGLESDPTPVRNDFFGAGAIHLGSPGVSLT